MGATMDDLVNLPIIVEGTTTANPLSGIKQGRCVLLSITDKKMRLKKRAQKPVLMISPVAMYGTEDDTFLFSMPGYGAEIIDIRKIKPLLLYRMGMTMKAAGLLTNEINSLFKYNQQEK